MCSSERGDASADRDWYELYLGGRISRQRFEDGMCIGEGESGSRSLSMLPSLKGRGFKIVGCICLPLAVMLVSAPSQGGDCGCNMGWS